MAQTLSAEASLVGDPPALCRITLQISDDGASTPQLTLEQGAYTTSADGVCWTATGTPRVFDAYNSDCVAYRASDCALVIHPLSLDDTEAPAIVLKAAEQPAQDGGSGQFVPASFSALTELAASSFLKYWEAQAPGISGKACTSDNGRKLAPGTVSGVELLPHEVPNFRQALKLRPREERQGLSRRAFRRKQILAHFGMDADPSMLNAPHSKVKEADPASAEVQPDAPAAPAPAPTPAPAPAPSLAPETPIGSGPRRHPEPSTSHVVVPEPSVAPATDKRRRIPVDAGSALATSPEATTHALPAPAQPALSGRAQPEREHRREKSDGKRLGELAPSVSAYRGRTLIVRAPPAADISNVTSSPSSSYSSYAPLTSVALAATAAEFSESPAAVPAAYSVEAPASAHVDMSQHPMVMYQQQMQMQQYYAMMGSMGSMPVAMRAGAASAALPPHILPAHYAPPPSIGMPLHVAYLPVTTANGSVMYAPVSMPPMMMSAPGASTGSPAAAPVPLLPAFSPYATYDPRLGR